MNSADFAVEWIEAWNSHDLERILTHYAANVIVRTPVAARLLDDSDGVVEGLDAVRDYWRRGLDLLPDLRFTLIEAMEGVGGLTILYRNERDQRVAELIQFGSSDLIDNVSVFYGAVPAQVQPNPRQP